MLVFSNIIGISLILAKNDVLIKVFYKLNQLLCEIFQGVIGGLSILQKKAFI